MQGYPVPRSKVLQLHKVKARESMRREREVSISLIAGKFWKQPAGRAMFNMVVEEPRGKRAEVKHRGVAPDVSIRFRLYGFDS